MEYQTWQSVVIQLKNMIYEICRLDEMWLRGIGEFGGCAWSPGDFLF